MLPVTQQFAWIVQIEGQRWARVPSPAPAAPGSRRALMAAPRASAMRISLVQCGEQRSFGTPMQAMSAESKSLQLPCQVQHLEEKCCRIKLLKSSREPPRGTQKGARSPNSPMSIRQWPENFLLIFLNQAYSRSKRSKCAPK